MTCEEVLNEFFSELTRSYPFHETPVGIPGLCHLPTLLGPRFAFLMVRQLEDKRAEYYGLPDCVGIL